jgi:hypothetical protein
VDEDIRTMILRNEPVPFFRMKPLHGPLGPAMILLPWGVESMLPRMIRRTRKKPHAAAPLRFLNAHDGLALLARCNHCPDNGIRQTACQAIGSLRAYPAHW